MIKTRVKGEIFIVNNLLVGPNVVLRSNNLSFKKQNKAIRERDMTIGDIIIEDDVCIGFKCIMVPKCRISEGDFTAAVAPVTNNVDPYLIVGGILTKELIRMDPKN